MSSWKSLYRWLPFAALVLIAAGCYDKKSSYGTNPEQPTEAEAFWDKIHAQGYRTWNRAPGYEVRRPSAAAHGDSVDVYVNTVIVATLASGGNPSAWPQGSIIVKDGFQNGAQTLVAAMEKRSGGWYWAEYETGGRILASGSPTGCTGCHSSGSDFVRAFTLP